MDLVQPNDDVLQDVNPNLIPRKGIHKLRIPYLDIALVDTVGTIVCGMFIANYMNWSKTKTIGGLFISAYFIHDYFGVNTKMVETINDKIKSTD